MLRQAEQAYGNGQFGTAIGLLHQVSDQSDRLSIGDLSCYHTLSGLLAERAGNWAEAVRCRLAAFDDVIEDYVPTEHWSDGAADYVEIDTLTVVDWIRTSDRLDGEDPCDNWCDCDVRGVLDSPTVPYDEMPCECCPTHVLWGLVWRAAGRSALGAVLDAVPDPSGHRRTAVVHALALVALRALADGKAATSAHAVFVIAVWHLLLDEYDPLGFRPMITARRGASVPDQCWQDARDELAYRIRTTLRAVDEREDRDALNAWKTAWQVEHDEYSGELIRGEQAYLRVLECYGDCDEGRRASGDCDCSPDAWQSPSPDSLPPCLGLLHAGEHGRRGLPHEHPVPAGTAAGFLLEAGHHHALLDAYTRRHPDPDSWTAQSAAHRAYAPYVGRALIRRAHERNGKREWEGTLADFTTAVRLGIDLDNRDREGVRQAGLSAGQNGNGYQNASLVQRIHWLESAIALAPCDPVLPGELAATLVRRGKEAVRLNRHEGQQRFERALELCPDNRDARDELDALLIADIVDVLEGTRPGRKPGVTKVEQLLRRRLRAGSDAPDPGCARVLHWFADRMIDRVVDHALAGDRDSARRKMQRLYSVDPRTEQHSTNEVDPTIARLLRERAAQDLQHPPREYARRLRLLFSAAAKFDHLPGAAAEEELVEAVLPLAAEMVDEGREDELIELYVSAPVSPGYSADFDQLIATAYGRRAKARRKLGDIGGAVRDERTAAKLRLQPSWQPSLFGPAAPPSGRGGSAPSQEML
ncbi:hypothetical protein [Streptomyces sp. NBC_00154]|uniref:hypothetical protein n=1 Tax=Streptomyces sp. NBC_00154 TaxID=2975670 RepID=UPI0022577C66|nr:hypothetical protein [Streptomyces sp. NBC_00154]MCX5314779.1 hypothetical protein [Streptomyces sp. NBC_00154]